MISLLCSKEELPGKIQTLVHVFHLKHIYQLLVLYKVCTYRLWTALINDPAFRKWPSSRYVPFTYIYLSIFSLSQKSYRQKLDWYVNSELWKKEDFNLLNELCRHLSGVTEKTHRNFSKPFRDTNKKGLLSNM